MTNSEVRKVIEEMKNKTFAGMGKVSIYPDKELDALQHCLSIMQDYERQEEKHRTCHLKNAEYINEIVKLRADYEEMKHDKEAVMDALEQCKIEKDRLHSIAFLVACTALDQLKEK